MPKTLVEKRIQIQTRTQIRAAIAVAFIAFGLSFIASAQADTTVHKSKLHSFAVEKLIDRDDVVWGFDFLPDGKIIFTEKSGKIFIIDPKDRKPIEVAGAPKVALLGQGGLLDIRVHPNFEKTPWIYLTFADPAEKGATTSLGRGLLKDNKIVEFKTLLKSNAASTAGQHFGSRIVFDGQGHVFFSIGDRSERDKVQDLSSHIGKTIRLNEDGSVPKDNPFVNQKGALPEIWSVGHRSPQGFVRHPETGELWLAEMGPRGGDELNRIEPGKNYGWPLVTQGREYWGPSIGKKQMSGMVDAVVFWVPSISPSGIAFYKGEAFNKWKGHLFIGNLSGQHLRRVVIEAGRVKDQEELLSDLDWRFRNVRPGPDGAIYISTDSGVIARLVPRQ